jgi:hypothetical protein
MGEDIPRYGSLLSIPSHLALNLSYFSNQDCAEARRAALWTLSFFPLAYLEDEFLSGEIPLFLLPNPKANKNHHAFL